MRGNPLVVAPKTDGVGLGVLPLLKERCFQAIVRSPENFYLRSDRKLLVVEAKNADLSRGFTQLAVELIALYLWSDSDEMR